MTTTESEMFYTVLLQLLTATKTLDLAKDEETCTFLDHLVASSSNLNKEKGKN